MEMYLVIQRSLNIDLQGLLDEATTLQYWYAHFPRGSFGVPICFVKTPRRSVWHLSGNDRTSDSQVECSKKEEVCWNTCEVSKLLESGRSSLWQDHRRQSYPMSTRDRLLLIPRCFWSLQRGLFWNRSLRIPICFWKLQGGLFWWLSKFPRTSLARAGSCGVLVALLLSYPLLSTLRQFSARILACDLVGSFWLLEQTCLLMRGIFL